MKNFNKLLYTFLFIIFLLPSLAFASWWNPVSWFTVTTSSSLNSNVPYGARSIPTTYSGNCSISGMTTLKEIVMSFVVGCIFARSIYFIIAIAILVFLYGIFKFVISEGDDKQAGRELMLWGVIGLFVIISVWGLVNVLQNTFNMSGNYDITPRQVSVPGLNYK